MPRFPYAGLPKHQIWKRAVADVAPGQIDPQTPGRFAFDAGARIGSAGSCFAARIADRLRAAGFTYLVTEDGPPERNFGRYSARYGDVYTTVQLAQLAQRAIGAFQPAEAPWEHEGRFFDPLRPRIEPGGFASLDELVADRRRHLAATRRVLAESDVFIVTLGLTEAWRSRADGTVFPLCPGAGIGRFDPARYEFVNFDVQQTVDALEAFLAIAHWLNPNLHVILTVSPVPLAATMEPRHVIASTVYSKSVLRVAAETVRGRHDWVDYFAAYEIVTGGWIPDAYASDRRDVSDAAVERVMASFFAAFVAPSATLPVVELALDTASAPSPRSAHDPCDEAYLAGFIAKG